MVRQAPALGVAAAAGFVLAGAAHLPGGEAALEWLVVHVPGSGLLRDGQKWLLPYVALVVASAGAATASAAAALRRRDPDLGRLLPAALVLVPVLAAARRGGPDLGGAGAGRLPGRPRGRGQPPWTARTGRATWPPLPWTSYRRFSWGNDLSAADPLPRWTRHPAVVADILPSAAGRVAGEDPRARASGEVIDADGPVAEDLAGLGIGWVLVYRDQPGAAT